MPSKNAPAGVQPDLIYDFGMNRCEDTDFYLAKGFRVVAIEANPAACRAAAARYPEQLAKGRLTIVNRALSQDGTPLRFWICDTNMSWSTASPVVRDEWVARGAVFHEEEAPGVTVHELVETYGAPYYAKIDLEGFDLLCLKQWGDAAARPPYVSFEVDFSVLRDMVQTSLSLGYRDFAMIGQSTVAQQTLPRPSREGRDIEYVIRRGSSGLFGRELPGPWVSAEQVTREGRRVIRQHKLGGALRRLEGLLPPLRPLVRGFQDQLPLARDWYDIHARLPESLRASGGA